MSRSFSVWLAEDDADMRALLVQALQRDNHDVFVMSDGASLLECLRAAAGGSRKPDAVVSDICMPGISGLDVLRTMRRLHVDVPVFLITGFGDEALHADAHAAGATHTFAKPFDFDDLRTALLNLGPRPR